MVKKCLQANLLNLSEELIHVDTHTDTQSKPLAAKAEVHFSVL